LAKVFSSKLLVNQWVVVWQLLKQISRERVTLASSLWYAFQFLFWFKLTPAQNSKNSQKTLFKPKPLTLPFVFQNLRDIALSAGHSSQAKKVSIITKLLAACQDFEAKYIVRSLEGKLRIGNAERSVLVALAHAAVLAEKERCKWVFAQHVKTANSKI
jgi:ATP-dependent DNA ligase